MIIGLDEVGRGCWAGPLVAGAVLLAKPIKGLKDSKKLTKIQRQRLDAEIKISALQFGLGWVTAAEIDKAGLTAAVRLAMERAFMAITLPYDQVVIDGSFNFLNDNPKSIALAGADNTEPSVSAASIIAKVARDKYMADIAKEFPGYGFEKHVGYGTASHNAAIKTQGLCALHRRSFKPIQTYL